MGNRSLDRRRWWTKLLDLLIGKPYETVEVEPQVELSIQKSMREVFEARGLGMMYGDPRRIVILGDRIVAHSGSSFHGRDQYVEFDRTSLQPLRLVLVNLEHNHREEFDLLQNSPPMEAPPVSGFDRRIG